MTLRVNYKKIIQYILIYMMLIVNQSNMYSYFLSDYNFLILIAIMAFVVILHRKSLFIIGFITFLLLYVIFIRLLIGGVGLSAWINWTIKIELCYLTVNVNKTEFFNNYLKVVRVLAIFSIVGYLLGIVAPEIFTSGLFVQYATTFESERTWITQNSYVANHFNSYGLLFYSYTEHETMRNIGIFTEPGIYQMVLNSGIFIILFYTEHLSTKNRNKRMSTLLIFVIALFTCQSTTGYIGFLIILFIYIIQKNKDNIKMKHRVFMITGIVLICAIVDFYVRGENSFLETTIFKKLLNESGTFDIMADTGAYRYGMILLAIQTMLSHPFGVGYDRFRYLANAGETGFVAAQILQTGAVYGIIMFLAIVVWIVYPIVRFEKRKSCVFLILFLYFNTALAQSSEFYPVLIMFGIYHMMFFTISGSGKLEYKTRVKE